MNKIPDTFIQQIITQAESTYPKECCGMVMGLKSDSESFSRVRPCENVYDRYHELDPDNFPRTSEKAYFIDPKELLSIQKEMRANDEEIRVIYHSHNDVGDYFSEEDQRVAIYEGAPAYPGVQYYVFSIMKGKAAEGTPKIYRWSEKEKKYV